MNLIRCESNPPIMGRNFRRDNCKVFCLLILTLFTFDMLIRKYTNHIGINILQHISTCKQQQQQQQQQQQHAPIIR